MCNPCKDKNIFDEYTMEDLFQQKLNLMDYLKGPCIEGLQRSSVWPKRCSWSYLQYIGSRVMHHDNVCQPL